MIVKLICADCGKEIKPHDTSSLVPDEVKIKISTCTCRTVTCKDCEDLEILRKDLKESEEKVKSLEDQLV